MPLSQRLDLSFCFEGFTTAVRFGPCTANSLPPGALLVVDPNTEEPRRRFGLIPASEESTEALRRVIIPTGEAGKTWSTIEAILGRAVDMGTGRDGTFVGIGGGAVCDVTALAASVFMRGARLELVPTTLLAMVDAALGGKTGINFRGLKNLVGTFYPARVLHIDVRFLETLPETEYRSGLAEVLKSAMLGDPELFDILEDRAAELAPGGGGRPAPGLMEDLVRRCVAVKGRVVAADLRESGAEGAEGPALAGREVLNLGHTFGHGLEAAAGIGNLTHGDCVAWGIFRALEAGERLGITEKAYARRARELLRRYGYKESYSGPRVEAVMEAMRHDKKARTGKMRFVLQRGLTDTVITPIEDQLVSEVLAAGLTKG